MTDHTPNLPRIFFTKVGNQKLRTAIWSGVDKGYGKRTPLLFFNGIGANLEIAQAFADTFTGRDIITFDMPGVGGSPDPTVPYRPWWVAKAAKQILTENGYPKVSSTICVAKRENDETIGTLRDDNGRDDGARKPQSFIENAIAQTLY